MDKVNGQGTRVSEYSIKEGAPFRKDLGEAGGWNTRAKEIDKVWLAMTVGTS